MHEDVAIQNILGKSERLPQNQNERGSQTGKESTHSPPKDKVTCRTLSLQYCREKQRTLWKYFILICLLMSFMTIQIKQHYIVSYVVKVFLNYTLMIFIFSKERIYTTVLQESCEKLNYFCHVNPFSQSLQELFFFPL